MKKTYIAPNMEVIKMTATQMLAGSGNLGSSSTPTVGFRDAGNGGDYDDAD